MNFKKALFAIKMGLMCLCLPSVGFADGLDDNSWRIYLESHYPQISLSDVKTWQDQTENLLKSKGVVHQRLGLITISTYFKLWSINYGTAETPNFEILKNNIDYWISELGLNGLNQFIENTTHQNPYHLFKINLEGWKAFHDLLVNIGVFDFNRDSDRSLKAFLLRFYWGEGISTSHSKTAEFWQSWKSLFLSHQKISLTIADSFSVIFLSQSRNHDLIQRLYISMTKELFQLVLKYPEYISTDFLLDILNPKDNVLRFMFSSAIEDVVVNLKILVENQTKVGGQVFTISLAQRVLSKLVFRVIEDPNILKNEKYFKLVIKEILLDLKKKSDSISTLTDSLICEKFLR